MQRPSLPPRHISPVALLINVCCVPLFYVQFGAKIECENVARAFEKFVYADMIVSHQSEAGSGLSQVMVIFGVVTVMKNTTMTKLIFKRKK